MDFPDFTKIRKNKFRKIFVFHPTAKVSTCKHLKDWPIGKISEISTDALFFWFGKSIYLSVSLLFTLCWQLRISIVYNKNSKNIPIDVNVNQHKKLYIIYSKKYIWLKKGLKDMPYPAREILISKKRDAS